MASHATIANRPNWSSVAVATGEEATLPWLMSQAPVASHLHLACHGSNPLDEDEGSKLWLAGGQPLTVRVAQVTRRVSVG
jgi:hypothetical protein